MECDYLFFECSMISIQEEIYLIFNSLFFFYLKIKNHFEI